MSNDLTALIGNPHPHGGLIAPPGDFLFAGIAIPRECIALSTSLAVVFPSHKPITQGHMLVCPRRCCPSFSDLTGDELADMVYLSQLVLRFTAFSLGGEQLLSIQDGPDSGRTVPHVHFHITTSIDTGKIENERGPVLSQAEMEATSARLRQFYCENNLSIQFISLQIQIDFVPSLIAISNSAHWRGRPLYNYGMQCVIDVIGRKADFCSNPWTGYEGDDLPIVLVRYKTKMLKQSRKIRILPLTQPITEDTSINCRNAPSVESLYQFSKSILGGVTKRGVGPIKTPFILVDILHETWIANNGNMKQFIETAKNLDVRTELGVAVLSEEQSRCIGAMLYDTELYEGNIFSTMFKWTGEDASQYSPESDVTPVVDVHALESDDYQFDSAVIQPVHQSLASATYSHGFEDNNANLLMEIDAIIHEYQTTRSFVLRENDKKAICSLVRLWIDTRTSEESGAQI